MKRKLNFIFLILLLGNSCKSKEVEIVIDTGISYKIDLKNKIYITYYQNKSPIEVKFKLSEVEEKRIDKQYNELKPFLTGDETIVVDSCLKNSPTVETILSIKSFEKNDKIIIDINCNKYTKNPDITKIKQIKDLINCVFEIVYSKPGIKGVPPSDRIYY